MVSYLIKSFLVLCQWNVWKLKYAFLNSGKCRYHKDIDLWKFLKLSLIWMAIVDPWSLCHVIYKVLQQFDPNVVMLDICYGIIHKKGQKEKQGNESRERERERESFSFI